MTNQELHDIKIENLAQEYRDKGYTVIVEPQGGDIPSFLGGLQPDIIATKPGSSIIAEVKNKADLKTSDTARRMADLVSKQQGWDFQLVIVSEQEASDIPTKSDLLVPEEIRQYLDVSERSKASGELRVAFIIAWVGLEASLRLLANYYEVSTSILSPRALLKELSFQGAIESDQFRQLDKLAQMRARVIHGFEEKRLSVTVVNDLIEAASSLLADVQNPISGNLPEVDRDCPPL